MVAGTQELQKREAKAVETAKRRVFSPRADVHETDEAIVVVADLPGVADNSVEITLEQDVLTIKGEKETTRPEGFRLSYGERWNGDYERSFALSERVDKEKIEAGIKDGVLRLTLPKVRAAVARRIEVKAG